MAKSELHCELAHRALVWLEGRATGRGIRGCEEICLKAGYVADSVAISGLTHSNEKLFLGSEYRRKDGNNASGIADDYVFIFESKVSRADFFNTFKRGNHLGDRMLPVGNFHFVVTPKNMIKAEEVPEFWGLLEQRGTGLGIVKMPTFKEISEQQLHEVAYDILRGSHFGKFTLYTDLVLKYREEQTHFNKSPTTIMEIKDEIQIIDSHGFRHLVVINHHPELGLSIAWHDRKRIASREYGRMMPPTSDTDKEWEEWEERFREFADGIISDLQLSCREYINEKHI